MGKYELLLAAVLLPVLSSILCYTVRSSIARKVIVTISTFIMIAVSAGFISLLLRSNGRVEISTEGWGFPVSPGILIEIADYALLLFIAYIGIKNKRLLVIGLTFLQIIPMIIFQITGNIKEPHISFVIDYLSLIMILLVSIIGPIIVVFALGYMEEHEQHQHLEKSKQPKFFAILFVFLAAMNALVMTDNLAWLYFFWEITTLCSFLLISHDGNEQSIKNAFRALWINMVGGVAFVFAIIIIYTTHKTLSIQEIINIKGSFTGVFPIAIGLLCLAGFTKSAQFPFQSWLLGAMVAPTPVSALLHSSTMVKAGVYLVVRMSPAYSNTLLGQVVAVVGGFTFLAGSAVAVSQRNAKRVLAYSTIANLGLIICCAGIGSNVAIGAAILLIIFHAVSKALLFLCVGTIEHGIGSRDIEDMQGLMKKMPFTTVITVIGMISMLLPPFGVLITKWLAIEAAIKLPLVLILIVLGSAFTVVFWTKWIGIILTMSYKSKYVMEKLASSVKLTLASLTAGVLLISIFISQIFAKFIEPFLKTSIKKDTSVKLVSSSGIWIVNRANNFVGGVSTVYFFMLLCLIALTVPYFLRKKSIAERIKPPYLCGENVDNDIRGLQFATVADKRENAVVRNYYHLGILGEEKLTLWLNALAGAIILIMFGVVI